MVDLLAFLLPNYITEGKRRLVIGIGCTGGAHVTASAKGSGYGGNIKLHIGAHGNTVYSRLGGLTNGGLS